jgi:DsbC/DsbD-like thiol-disulfide interchange protein
VTVRNLLRLASFSKQAEYRNRARQTLELFVPLIPEAPGGLTNMALALDEYLDVNEPATGSVGPAQKTLGIAPDPEILLAAGEQTGPAGTKKTNKPEHVTGQAFLSVDRLPAGGKCKVAVELKIDDGWHIHANPPGDADLDIPTEFTIESKLEVELINIRYPAGKKVDRGPGEKPQLHYSGKVLLVGELEVPAATAGKREDLVLLINYQACNDNRCLAPKKLKLTVPVTVARQGEAVKPANEAVFAPPKKK